NSFEALVEAFQLALYQHYNTEEESPLYSSPVMRDFAEEHAPGLYNIIFKSITRSNDNRISKAREELQHQRTVVILHTLAYFRSQKTSRMQKDEGLFLHQHGTSRTALNCGRVLGYGTSPRDIDNYKIRITKSYPAIIERQIVGATKVSDNKM
ncbi:hypothetical protein QZH41_015158, partial [Actinostola sp. cb2023]